MKPKLIIHQEGRLGNQLFSIANGISFCLDNDYEPYTDTPYEINNYIHNPLPVVDRSTPCVVYKNENPGFFSFKERISRVDTNIQGYYQSEKFFRKHENAIRMFMKCKYEDDIKKHYNNILSHKYTISIHVRRSDYLHDPGFNVMPIDYYRRAIRHILKELHYPEDYMFLIFSDDIDWCIKNFGESSHFTFIDSKPNLNHIPKHINDLYLMSYCKHNIVANSSYSWWGAWLNQSKNKIVISPNHLKCFNHKALDPGYSSDFEDYFPSSWVNLDFNYINPPAKFEFTLSPINGWQYHRAHEIVKYTGSLHVLDMTGLLQDCPKIVSYNESHSVYDLICVKDLSNISLSRRWVLLYTNKNVDLSHHRHLKFTNANNVVNMNLYLIDLKPPLIKNLYVRCINLNHRNDRWVYTNLPRQKAFVGRATDYKPENLTDGQIGCLKSQDCIVFSAWMNNYKYCLFFEDDIILQSNFFPNLNGVLDELNQREWDICKLSAIIWNRQPINRVSEHLYNMDSSGNQALLIHNNAYSRFMTELSTHTSPADDVVKPTTFKLFVRIPFLATITNDPTSDIVEDKPEAFELRKSIVDHFYQDTGKNIVYVNLTESSVDYHRIDILVNHLKSMISNVTVVTCYPNNTPELEKHFDKVFAPTNKFTYYNALREVVSQVSSDEQLANFIVICPHVGLRIATDIFQKPMNILVDKDDLKSSVFKIYSSSFNFFKNKLDGIETQVLCSSLNNHLISCFDKYSVINFETYFYVY